MEPLASRENGIKLFFFGFLTLFLELALIRYLAGNIYNLGYFPNLVLLAVFIGMGTGFVFHRYFSEKLSVWAFGMSTFLLLALILLVYLCRPAVPGFSGSGVDLGGEIFFSGSPAQDQKTSMILFVCIFLFIVGQFCLISQRTAKYFRLFPPLRSYSLDITGSCCGIVAFMIISWLKIPAYLWFVALIPVMILLQDLHR